ncbi:MAG: 50S ribosomal protein L3 [Candidatus Eisenbacteria bacterium]|nr:50S ribosomal protein L3 [Candidatus Eisenbacteria bacterium]
MTGIIGKKLGMTRIFDEDGTAVPVTVIEAGPCVVTQVKTKDIDGYEAVQLGFDRARPKSVRKPRAGHFEKAGVVPLRKLSEFRVNDPGQYSLGQEVRVDIFEPGELVDVVGTSKGRGFQGSVRRHGKSVGRRTHGNKNRRAPGSIGQSASPAKVWKGRKLPGRMGCDRVTIRSISIVEVDAEKNLLLVKGSVPGPSNQYVIVRKHGAVA